MPEDDERYKDKKVIKRLGRGYGMSVGNAG